MGGAYWLTERIVRIFFFTIIFRYFTKILNLPIRFQEYTKNLYGYEDNPFRKVAGTFFFVQLIILNFSKIFGRKDVAFATSSKDNNDSRVLRSLSPKDISIGSTIVFIRTKQNGKLNAKF